MRAADFDQIVEEAFARIPGRFRKRLENVAIIVEPEPQPSQLRGYGTLLGLYEGRPLPYRSVSEPFSMPDKITIFQGPHERLARDDNHLRKMVADTLWHEIAHYFGMDEARVRRAERRRTRKAKASPAPSAESADG